MRLFRAFASKLVRYGPLTIVDSDGSCASFGERHPAIKPVTVRFADRRVSAFIARNPHLHAAEAFIDGRLIIEQGDIRDLINLIRANGRWDEGQESRLFGTPLHNLRNWLRSLFDRVNRESRSRSNVAHHYDLDDRLYRLFLDVDRQYSCAYFVNDDVSLDQAQHDKKAHIAAKLALRPGLRVLDIGCGWGGMALYLNRVANVDVLGITLSEEQLGVARQRAADAGVADRVKFELIDYRKLKGQFDRIVSVGMFEHVGAPHYRQFFRQCRTLLTEDGVMLLHTIGRLGVPGHTDAFTLKYIFPGGYNPALSEIIAASETCRLIPADIETLRLHYGKTLDHWYDRTMAARAEIEALYDARFFRLWTFYLAGARAAFLHGMLCNYQIQYIRRRETLPITRDYMLAAETELKKSAARTG